MGMLKEYGKEKIRIKSVINYLKYKIEFRKIHVDYFDADGLLCFIGPQGSGKTLSAVNYVYRLMQEYPNAKLCTNLLLTDYPVVSEVEFRDKNIFLIKLLRSQGLGDVKINKILEEMYLKDNRVFPFNNNDDFVKYSNGEQGVIYLVDEIQLYLNSLESKNVNLDTVTQISQQRKQRKHIVTTSQVFGRMAKPLREQFSNVVVCKNYLGFIQKNSLVDRDSLDTESSSGTDISGKVEKNFIWVHDPKMYKRYDTYYVIEKGKFVSGEKQKEGVFDNANVIRLSADN